MATVDTYLIDGKEFVLACDHTPKTNGLGKVQRAIVDYLATAPNGFPDFYQNGSKHPVVDEYRYAAGYSPESDLLWHCAPRGATVASITMNVYGTEALTASQTRVVQRNVRRLQELDLVWCRHGVVKVRRDAYTTALGFKADQPVSGLIAGLHWRCEHVAEQERLIAEWDHAYEEKWREIRKRDDGQAVAALQAAFRPAP